MSNIKTHLAFVCAALLCVPAHANEKWVCEPAKIKRLPSFVMAPSSYSATFAGGVNEVALVNRHIAKFSNSKGYQGEWGSERLSCEETLDAELNPEDPVLLQVCTLPPSSVTPNCPRPSDQVSLTFLSDSEVVFVKDACESQLRKYLITQEFDRVFTLVSEQKYYQDKHQKWAGTKRDDSPDLKFNTYDRTLSLSGSTYIRRAGFSTVPYYFHEYRLKLQCAEG